MLRLRFPDIRNKQSGQSIVIVAFMVIVLFGGVGLTIDGANAFYNNSSAERGAAAAALAGVIFMPNQFTPAQALPAGSRNDAQDRAYDEAKRNGFANGAANVVVTPAAYPGQPGWFQVTIQKQIPTFFMSIFGINQVTVSRTAVAGYLSAINIGQPGTTLGSTVSQLGTPGNFYFLRSEGWNTDRQQGDPYTPNPCHEYGANPVSSPCPNDVHQFSGINDPVGTALGLPGRGGQNFMVNIPAGGGTIWVYNAAFAPDYRKNVGGGCAGNNCSYHNPCENMAPSSNAAVPWGHGRTCATMPGPTPYHFGGSDWNSTAYEYHEADSNGSGDTADKYSAMGYTLFKVPNPFFRNFDATVSQMTVLPIDATNFDPAATTAPTYKSVSQAGAPTITQTYSCSPLPCAGSATNMWVYHHWANVQSYAGGNDYAPGESSIVNLNQIDTSFSGELPAGTYRLRVDTLDYQGNDPETNDGNSVAHKGYAVAVSGPGATTGPIACAGCTLSAWNDMTYYTPVQGSAFTVPIFALPVAYAGQTVVIDIYDVGDVSGSGNLNIDIMDPDPVNGGIASAPPGKFIDIFDLGRQRATTNPPFGTACAYAGSGVSEWTTNAPCTISHSSAANSGTFVSFLTAGGKTLYNGHWVHMEVPIRANYNPAGSNGYWSMRYNAPSGVTASDTLSIRVGLKGAPAHLLMS